MMSETKIRSMTGYGRGESDAEGIRFTVEVRSVNHRFLELAVKLPSGWGALEEEVKRQVRRWVRRGRVDVTVTLEGDGAASRKLTVDWEAADSLLQASRELRERLGITGELTLRDLLHHSEVLKAEEQMPDPEVWKAPLLTAVEQACQSLGGMRRREGRVLAEDLMHRTGVLAQRVEEIRSRAPQVVSDYRRRLEERIRELLGGVDPEPDRLLTEAALFADKADIQEELTRLSSHIGQFREALRQEKPVGRRLEFLLQEMNREINTIGSKANDAQIAEKVVDSKSELEKMREQVQNIE